MAGKYKPYPAYKPPSVEWLVDIPEGWMLLRGKYVFDEINERSMLGNETLLSVSEYYGVKPRSEAISDGEFLSRAVSLVGYKKCEVNDLAMNIMLAWKRGLGVSKFSGIVSPAYSVFRFREFANPKFMHYLLRTDAYVDHFKSRSTGVIDSRLRLYPDTFADIKILCPSTFEQTKIAAFLDHETAKIDVLIAKQQRLIALLEEKRQAVISHAVTKGLNPNVPLRPSGIDWLGEVPAHWEVKSAKHVADIFVPQRNKPDLNERDGVSWATMDDMKSKYIGRTRFHVDDTAARIAGSKTLVKGAVIASCVGNFGIASINQIEVIINQQLQAFIPRNILPEYLREIVSISKVYFEQVGTAATLIYVNQEGFENLPVLQPPVCEQTDICQFAEQQDRKFEAVLNKTQTAITLLKERRTALISAAVTGKVDLRDWRPPKSVSNRNLDIAEEAVA